MEKARSKTNHRDQHQQDGDMRHPEGRGVENDTLLPSLPEGPDHEHKRGNGSKREYTLPAVLAETIDHLLAETRCKGVNKMNAGKNQNGNDEHDHGAVPLRVRESCSQ
nr:hypothetical protein [Marinicella sp. W31]MDC2878089.1 hypothetical protein [Marinicella sp. W31]